MSKNYHSHAVLSVKTLLFVDLVFMYSALMLITQNNSELQIIGTLQYLFLFIFVVINQFVFLSLGLYHAKLREKPFGIFKRGFLANCITHVIIFLLLTYIDYPYFEYKFLVEYSVITFLLCSSFRVLLFSFNILGFTKRNVLVLGSGKRAEIIVQRMRRDVDRRNFNLIGFIEMPGDLSSSIDPLEVMPQDTDILSLVRSGPIHEIVVATDERRNNLPIDILFHCRIRGVEITEILDFIEKETGQIAVNLMYPSWVIYSNGFSSRNSVQKHLDWVFNAFLATVLFLISWPFMLLAIIAIKLEDGISAPCLYLQERVGLDGNIFKIIKFRSMNLSAESNGAQWAAKEDARVTEVGAILRKYRIDELPQIYNVLVGEMSFVGPRPERPEFVNDLVNKIPYYNERHHVKSGLTGWAQLKYPYGASDKDSAEKLKYDLYYIKHRSFFLDILILIQTTEIVLFGKGR